MEVNDFLGYQFPEQTYEAWQEKAQQALKGKPVDVLESTTYEKIKIKPLYTKEDRQDEGFPGVPDFRRGINPLGYRNIGWGIAQTISWETPDELGKKLADSFSKGQTAISFDTEKGIPAEVTPAVAPYASVYPFSINAGSSQFALLEELGKAGTDNLTGYIGSDPLPVASKAGQLDEWGGKIAEAAQKHPALRTILVDAGIYHSEGANAVQELAAAMATGVFYVEALSGTGMAIDAIFEKVVFKFQIGANFFMEIAKLRAARILWNKIGEVYGAGEKSRSMVIAAETSQFTKTLFDPHVNLLRAGNEAFAAVLGGVQYLHVGPFNELSGATPFSERLARNIQLILREEAYLDKVADPAGGSWYIEELTEQLATHSWEIFGQIDSLGGMAAVLESGWFKKEIAMTLKERFMDIKTRRQSIIGTNIYANLNEDKPEVMQGNEIPKTRLATPFEEIRLKALTLAGKGLKPAFGLICLGSLKDSKARADFAEGFLAPGGVHSARSGVVSTLEETEAFVEASGLTHFFICSSNEFYDGPGLEIAKELLKRYPGFSFYLAGVPENRDSWAESGIKDFIHIRSNCHEFLVAVIEGMEAAVNE